MGRETKLMNRVFKTFCVLTFIVSSSYATSKALDPVFSFDRASNQEHASLTRSPSSEVNENIEYPAPLAVQDPAIHPTNPVIDPIRFSAL